MRTKIMDVPKNILTYNTKIISDAESTVFAVQTMKLHDQIWNDLSLCLFEKARTSNKVPSTKDFHKVHYYNMRKKYPSANSQLVIKAEQAVLSAFRSIKSNRKLKTLEAAPIKKKLSVQLDARIFRMTDTNEFSMTTIDGRKRFKILLYPRLEEMFKSYRMCDPKIFEKDGQLYLSIPFELPVPLHVEKRCIGLDMGIKRFVTTSEGDAFKNKKFADEMRKLRFIKRQLQSKAKHSHSAKTRLKNIRKKQTNKNKQMCHQIANKILKTTTDVIVMEDLTNLKQNKKGKMRKSFNNRNSQVPYFMFRAILAYKALSLGKRVETVSPYMTSRDDYRGLEKGKRQGCRYFASDGKVFDADWNAAINITQRYSKTNDKLPISFSEPLDGKLNLIGRPSSTGQS
jgi:IS605 OrfB family transposase